MSYTLAQDQFKKLFNDTSDGAANFYRGYEDILSFLQNPEPGQNPQAISAGTLYWYDHAPLINDPNGSDPSRYYIRDVTEYGEVLNNKPTGNTQSISDSIATNVIKEILRTDALPDVSQLLALDINTAISTYGLKYGGWGGSFYYWSSTPAGQTTTVGSQITASMSSLGDFDCGGQFDVFVASNAAALSDTGLTLNTVQNVFAYATDYGATVPYSYGFDVFGRDLEIRAGLPIVGDPDDINGYISAGGSWFLPDYNPNEATATTLPVDSADSAVLNSEQAFRQEYQGIHGGNNRTDLTSPGYSPTLPSTPNHPEGTFGALVNPDGSYSCTEINPNGSPANPVDAYVDTTFYTATGVEYAFKDQQIGSATATLASVTPTESVTAELDYVPVSAGSTTSMLQGAFLDGDGTTWLSASEAFNYNGSMSASIELPQDQGIYYQMQPNGYWSSSVSERNLNEFIDYGMQFDPATGQSFVGTAVTPNEPGAATTYYKEGDRNAPGNQVPAAIPLTSSGAFAFYQSHLPIIST